jgi:xanthine/CO dehydrogenase XdhC/CoxF family maturation factor
MTELERLAAALAAPAGGSAVLATLVGVEGSAFRGIGARLLLLPDGSAVGAISGGCLERDLAAHADAVRDGGAPRIVRYDLTRDDDAPWGPGLGCAATLEVLLEPLPTGIVPDWLRDTIAAARRREACVLGTVVGAVGGRDVGSHLVFLTTGTQATDATRALRERRTRVEAGALYEYLEPPIQVIVCGDGPDAAAVGEMATALGWAVRSLHGDEVPASADRWTAAVLMSHRYERDRALLAAFLPSAARYIGLLGPRARAQRLLHDVAADGADLAAFDRLHAPIGLDIGAETPAEIALSIVAEIRAAFAHRSGGCLRERGAPIHDRGR